MEKYLVFLTDFSQTTVNQLGIYQLVTPDIERPTQKSNNSKICQRYTCLKVEREVKGVRADLTLTPPKELANDNYGKILPQLT